MIKQLWKKTCTCLLILGLVLTMAPVKTLKAEDPVITDPTEAERVLRETLAGVVVDNSCLLYTSPSPRDRQKSRMPSSA